MGSYCVSGFHSHIPIHEGNKVVAIVCRVNTDETVSNTPCYLEGYISPIAMPIIGLMGDYGMLDEWKESETTKLFESYTKMKFGKIMEDILRCSPYAKEDEYPEIFGILDKVGAYVGNNPPKHKYTIIYEHYSIYKSMTFDDSDVRDFLVETDNINKSIMRVYPNYNPSEIHKYYPNVLTHLNKSYARDFVFFQRKRNLLVDLKKRVENGEELETLIKKDYVEEYRNKIQNISSELTQEEIELDNAIDIYFNREDAYMLDNYNNHLQGFMSLYYMGVYDIAAMIDEIIDWIGFVQTLDNIGGHFYYSVNAGQDWHHDANYISSYKSLLQEMMTTLDNLNKKCDLNGNVISVDDEDDELEFYEQDDTNLDFLEDGEELLGYMADVEE